MSAWNDQTIRAWEEWVGESDEEINDPDQFIDWAMRLGKLAPQPQDVRRLLRRQVVRALREITRTDENGITYRAKQCIRYAEDGNQLSMWFDIDKATPNLMKKSTAQKRKSIVDYCYRAKQDVDHFNGAHADIEPIQFVLDFTDDVAELEAEASARDESEAA